MTNAERADLAVDVLSRASGVIAEWAKSLSKQAGEHWDADRDSKVGKYLSALSGYLPRYRDDADNIHAVLKEAEALEAEEEDALRKRTNQQSAWVCAVCRREQAM